MKLLNTLATLLILFLLPIFSFAITANYSPYCPDEIELNVKYNAEEAFQLLERLQYFGVKSDFSSTNWKSFIKLLNDHKIEIKDVRVTLVRQCDVNPAMASRDKIMSPFSKSLNQVDIVVSTTSSQMITDSIKTPSGVHHSAVSNNSISLSARVFKEKSCDSILMCGERIRQVYIDSVASSRIISYSTGGMSTAGGGSKPKNNLNPFFKFSEEQYLLPGFKEMFINEGKKLPYFEGLIKFQGPDEYSFPK